LRFYDRRKFSRERESFLFPFFRSFFTSFPRLLRKISWFMMYENELSCFSHESFVNFIHDRVFSENNVKYPSLHYIFLLCRLLMTWSLKALLHQFIFLFSTSLSSLINNLLSIAFIKVFIVRCLLSSLPYLYFQVSRVEIEYSAVFFSLLLVFSFATLFTIYAIRDVKMYAFK
jgi:hypothetical protein